MLNLFEFCIILLASNYLGMTMLALIQHQGERRGVVVPPPCHPLVSMHKPTSGDLSFLYRACASACMCICWTLCGQSCVGSGESKHRAADAAQRASLQHVSELVLGVQAGSSALSRMRRRSQTCATALLASGAWMTLRTLRLLRSSRKPLPRRRTLF